MLVRDLSYVLGFRAPPKPRKREQLDLFAAPGPRQLALGETAPYPAPPREVPPQVPMFTGPAAAPASKPARPRRAPAAAARPLEELPPAEAAAQMQRNLEERQRAAAEHFRRNPRIPPASPVPLNTPAKESYDEAKQRLLFQLSRRGWYVRTLDKNTGRILATPWAETLDGRIRVYFKDQATWASLQPPGSDHSIKGASSLMLDRRAMPVDAFIEKAEKAWAIHAREDR